MKHVLWLLPRTPTSCALHPIWTIWNVSSRSSPSHSRDPCLFLIYINRASSICVLSIFISWFDGLSYSHYTLFVFFFFAGRHLAMMFQLKFFLRSDTVHLPFDCKFPHEFLEFVILSGRPHVIPLLFEESKSTRYCSLKSSSWLYCKLHCIVQTWSLRSRGLSG